MKKRFGFLLIGFAVFFFILCGCSNDNNSQTIEGKKFTELFENENMRNIMFNLPDSVDINIQKNSYAVSIFDFSDIESIKRISEAFDCLTVGKMKQVDTSEEIYDITFFWSGESCCVTFIGNLARIKRNTESGFYEISGIGELKKELDKTGEKFAGSQNISQTVFDKNNVKIEMNENVHFDDSGNFVLEFYGINKSENTVFIGLKDSSEIEGCFSSEPFMIPPFSETPFFVTIPSQSFSGADEFSFFLEVNNDILPYYSGIIKIPFY